MDEGTLMNSTTSTIITGTAHSSSTASPQPSTSSLPSPPSSPHNRDRQLDSIPGTPSSVASSFPSGASSYMFSISASSSPPHLHMGQGPLTDDGEPLGLVIPSLTLPPLISGYHDERGGSRRGSKRPHGVSGTTVYGETLGNLEIIMFGRNGAGKSAIANMLVDSNEDVVRVDGWDVDGRILSASTLSSGTPNVKIHESEGFDEEDGVAVEAIRGVIDDVHARYERLSSMLSEEALLDPALFELLSSPQTLLHTVLVFLLSSPPTPLELEILGQLSSHIPLVTLPPYPPSASSTRTSMSSMSLASQPHSSRPHSQTSTPPPLVFGTQTSGFRPRNTLELKKGLFRSPEVLKHLRRSAAERFIHWREARQVQPEMTSTTTLRTASSPLSLPHTLSHSSYSVANAMNAPWNSRLRGITETTEEAEDFNEKSASWLHVHDHNKEDTYSNIDDYKFGVAGDTEIPDPLHLPSLLRLSASLMVAAGRRLFQLLMGVEDDDDDLYGGPALNNSGMLDARERGRNVRSRRNQEQQQQQPARYKTGHKFGYGFTGFVFAFGMAAGFLLKGVRGGESPHSVAAAGLIKCT